MHLQVSTCVSLESEECVSPELIHDSLFPVEEKGFDSSAYKVTWIPDDAPSGK